MKRKHNLIMVIKRNTLFKQGYFEGFKYRDDTDYFSNILDNFEYMEREEAENNPEYKQPIGYCAIVNPGFKRIFAYQRSQDGFEYSEKRLMGKWSWGLGGHIEEKDSKNSHPIQASLLRELNEEVWLNINKRPKLLGYINDDNDDVGRVHFGILYALDTSADFVKPKDSEIKKGKLATLKELEEICSSPRFIVEDWSKISLSPLKLYLNKVT